MDARLDAVYQAVWIHWQIMHFNCLFLHSVRSVACARVCLAFTWNIIMFKTEITARLWQIAIFLSNALLVGSFMKIVYQYEGEGVEMWEYYQKDGTVAGSTNKWGDYSATYEINDIGEMCVTYAGSEAYSGCYSYERGADGSYKLVGLTWPENTTLDVEIVPGDTQNISVN